MPQVEDIERQTMGKCKDCKFWEKIDCTAVGRCDYLHGNLDHGHFQIVPRLSNQDATTKTLYDFGCTHFKKRQRGPFKVHIVPPGLNYGVYHQDRPGVYVHIFPKDGARRAERMADSLNDLWVQRETCEKESLK
jgi:hypothetical protein